VTRALAKDTFEDEEDLLAHYKSMNPALDIERARIPIMYNFRKLPDGRVTYKFDPSLRNRLIGQSPEEVERAQRAQADLEARTKDVKCPVLILRGELSDILMPDVAESTARAFPNAQLVEVPRTTHMIPTDDPLAFRSAVREFLGV